MSATRFKYTYQDSHASTSSLKNIHQVSNIDTKLRIFILRFAYIYQDTFLHDNIPMYTVRDQFFKRELQINVTRQDSSYMYIKIRIYIEIMIGLYEVLFHMVWLVT